MTVTPVQRDLGVPVAAEVDSDVVIDLTDGLTALGEPMGVVYTKPWVVGLILDLAGYRAEDDLANLYAVEPSAGEGAFLVPMVRRLLASIRHHGRPLADVRSALHAYELDENSAGQAVALIASELVDWGAPPAEAQTIARGWVTVGDYLLESRRDGMADLVVGNPPYIRYDDLSEHAYSVYRRLYPTMIGRCDIYVGFIEAGLRQLAEGGALAFICADRWMRSAYGAELRSLIAEAYGLEVVIEMHDAPAFESDVSAYPAVIVIRRAPQGRAIVASAGRAAGSSPEGNLANAVVGLADNRIEHLAGFSAVRVDRWFSGTDPWPSSEPHWLELLQHLEARYHTLEDPTTGTKVGIGVATGADAVFITSDDSLVEAARLLPLAMAADTKTGAVQWSGHYLVDPWSSTGKGLVDIDTYPRLRAYLERHRPKLEGRHVAKRQTERWYRTIDRVNHELTGRHKLYFPDMKMMSNPTLDRGETYPHHNLYYLVSDTWDLEILGGLLLSRIAQLFIEAYCVKMRGGTLRFQAQYLRRIRVPDPASLPEDVQRRLAAAFRSRDANAATLAAVEAYGIEDIWGALPC